MVFQRAAALLQVQDYVPSGVQNADAGEAPAGGGVLLRLRSRLGGEPVRARVPGLLRLRKVRRAEHVCVPARIRGTRLRHM